MKYPQVILYADEVTAKSVKNMKLEENPNLKVEVQKLADRVVRHRKAKEEELTIENTTGQEFWVVTIVD